MRAVRAANALTARWAETVSGSVVLSGAGVWPLLALLAEGAAGDARAELARALGRPADGAAEGAREILSILDGPGAARAAIGVWRRRGLALHDAWRALVPDGALGELTSRSALDAWAADRTDGLIPAMPVDLHDDTPLVAATALAVRTTWLRPFADGIEGITDGPWAGRDIAVVRRTGVHLDRVRRAETPAGPLTLARVMGTGGVDVHLVLGEERRAPGAVLAAAVGALADRRAVPGGALPFGAPSPGVRVVAARAHAPDDVLALTVPRFEVRSSHDLLDLPDVFGLRAVTDAARRPLAGISDAPLAIAGARQEALARFHARGFEAAAVTGFAAAAGVPPPPPYRVRRVEAVFDRPFGVLCADRRSGLVLAAAWIAEPEDAPG
ncbi:serpin family protein [Actinomadura atramentaria]|uniref:serpin family protein n=1 Tax=Actinomadura atramentaria TaxID=1990 RepID=UPI0004776F25|nr:serpin family protein [Actinomadura atramentaria]